MSWAPEIHIGEMRPWPDAVLVVRGETDEACRYVPCRTAIRISVPRQSHVALGHYECGECHGTVGASDAFCKHCGTRMEDE